MHASSVHPLSDTSDAASSPDTASPVETPAPLQDLVTQIEDDPKLDDLAAGIRSIAERMSRGRAGEVLRGRPLGHALHPLMTDLPLGCWLSANLLDLIGGRRARPAAQRLIGLGLLAVPLTAAAGMADYAGADDPRARRVGAVHAAGNTAVAAAYFVSWRARRRGHHLLGAAAGLVGGTAALFTGYLGGHLSFARGVGVGDRGARGGAPDGLGW